MNIFREIPPTAGFPIWLKDLFIRRPGSLEEDFQNYLRVPYAAVTYSGTSALYFILETLKKLSPKTTVVVPSFVCPLVPSAVVRAGLKVEVCDIVKDRFDYDHNELERICRDNQDILAVIAVHLAGIPVDLDSIGAITKKQGIFLVEDCAQALGAEYDGKKVGTIGDFGFFSLCRGKGLTIYEGGVAVAKEKYVSALKETISVLEKKDFFAEFLKIIEFLGYAVFYRPSLFWFVFKLPQILWLNRKDPVRAMGEYATKDFPTHAVSSFRKSFGHASFYHLDEEIAKQREKARLYFEEMKSVSGIHLIAEHEKAKASYPYITLVIGSDEKRGEILKKVNAKGLGVSIVYVSALSDYDFLGNIVPQRAFINAHYLAQHTVTLSTSTFLTNQGILDAARVVRSS